MPRSRSSLPCSSGTAPTCSAARGTMCDACAHPIGSRDSLLLPSLAKSRDSFTDSLLAANAFYLSPASQAGDEARANIATVEQTIPVMLDLADSGLQRDAVSALAQGAGAFREGL